MNTYIHLGLTLIAWLGAGPVQASFRVLEHAIEATPAQITLPARVGGSLTLRDCPSCAPRTLKTTAATTYLLGRQAVSLADFARVLADRPEVNVTVMTSVRDGAVTRIKVQSQATDPGAAPAR